MDLIEIAPAVARALAEGQPVVALETTLMTHGLPPPQGLAAARELEDAVRQEGALPATIGVLDGRARVGLSAQELERLAAAPHVEKLSLSNLASRIASGKPGSTTVAATMLLAHRAGITVLATGGIGGVHRGAAETGDVSADMTALSRIQLAVVCAGAKAVLDLPRTRELLETLGVPVLGFRSDRFPAFYRRDSGLLVDARCDAVEELAAALRAHWALGTGSGVVVAQPVAAEHELPADVYEAALARALVDAKGETGRDVTPFLLDRFRELTGGRSVAVNRALLLGNARLAGQLAAALAPLARP
jgi:pseudouridine-5'-phosphate glycosidase